MSEKFPDQKTTFKPMYNDVCFSFETCIHNLTWKWFVFSEKRGNFLKQIIYLWNQTIFTFVWKVMKFRFSRREKSWKRWLKKRHKNNAPEKDIAQGQNQMHSGAATYLLIIHGSGLVEHNIFHLVCKYLFWLCS